MRTSGTFKKRPLTLTYGVHGDKRIIEVEQALTTLVDLGLIVIVAAEMKPDVCLFSMSHILPVAAVYPTPDDTSGQKNIWFLLDTKELDRATADEYRCPDGSIIGPKVRFIPSTEQEGTRLLGQFTKLISQYDQEIFPEAVAVLA